MYHKYNQLWYTKKPLCASWGMVTLGHVVGTCWGTAVLCHTVGVGWGWLTLPEAIWGFLLWVRCFLQLQNHSVVRSSKPQCILSLVSPCLHICMHPVSLNSCHTVVTPNSCVACTGFPLASLTTLQYLLCSLSGMPSTSHLKTCASGVVTETRIYQDCSH